MERPVLQFHGAIDRCVVIDRDAFSCRARACEKRRGERSDPFRMLGHITTKEGQELVEYRVGVLRGRRVDDPDFVAFYDVADPLAGAQPKDGPDGRGKSRLRAFGKLAGNDR